MCSKSQNDKEEDVYAVSYTHLDVYKRQDPNWVVNHAYNVASYILEHDNPIQDGETIDGVADGQMCREIQWKCQYEDALIQPLRGVLDINMGECASGMR